MKPRSSEDGLLILVGPALILDGDEDDSDDGRTTICGALLVGHLRPHEGTRTVCLVHCCISVPNSVGAPNECLLNQ